MQTEHLLSWYHAHVRPHLETWAPQTVAALDNDANRLQALEALSEDALICCLGSAGVGKSTLLNALIADAEQILPSGGIGPLTAQAIRINYSDHPRFQAEYHTTSALWRLLLPLMTAVRRSGAMKEGDAIPSDVELSPEEVKEAVADSVDAGTPAPESRFAGLLRQARQLVRGDQFATSLDEKHLADALLAALHRPARFGTTSHPEDLVRIEQIHRAVMLGKSGMPRAFEARDDPQLFRTELDHHAAGFLAPLIKRLQVGWPTPLLQEGLAFVDLPGIGVHGDAHVQITREFVSEKAQAVILVVDRAGITESAMSLLHSSGYWNRLVASADDPESDPCALIVAVTRVDDVADEEWAKLSHLPKDVRPTKATKLRETVAAVCERILTQTQEQMGGAQTGAGDALTEARMRARERLLSEMVVFPVSAPEYRRLKANDEEDPPRLAKTLDDTGVPQLRAALRYLGEQLRDRRSEAIARVIGRFSRGIQFELQAPLLQAQTNSRAAAESQRIADELSLILQPLKIELADRRGSFRTFLNETSERRIGELVQEARADAEKEIRRYLRSLQDYPWNTLAAAVRRGGTFSGSRKIELPNTLSEMFQEPMAGVWSVKLLREIRARTKHYGDDCVAMVGEVARWARDQGSRVDRRLLNRQEQRLRDQVDQMREIGTEATDELRKVVKEELFKKISGPIRRRCEKFVEEGWAAGPGVKRRILGLFDELSEGAAQSATVPAKEILSRRFADVRELINKAFEEWQDPLQTAAEAIVSSNAQKLKSEDEKYQAQLANALNAVLAAAPVGWDREVAERDLRVDYAGTDLAKR